MNLSIFSNEQAPHEIPIWRLVQRDNFKDLSKLLAYLEFSEENKKFLLSRPRFPLNIPKRLVLKMKKNSLTDPIFKQFVPLEEEAVVSPDFLESPVQDETFQQSKKLLKKYHGRALLLASGACAMHCRYCFRQNYEYEVEVKNYGKELELLRLDPSIFEIILSGGDPLSLSDIVLKKLIQDLEAIDHLKILRFHTRFLIGIPERITAFFLDILSSTRLQVIFITHVNHALELDEDVIAAIKNIQKLGIPVLNHTVLLKGVNDQEAVLEDLFLKLISCGVLPYYLNQLDKVQGTQHFEVDINKGFSLIDTLKSRLPGYAIPEYIQEIPGDSSKTALKTLHTVHCS